MIPSRSLRAERLDADIAMHQFGIVDQILAVARPDGAALFQHIMPVGEPLQHMKVLVDQQNRLTFSLEPRDAGPDLGTNDRGKALGRFVQDEQFRLVIRARPTTSICCSPPDKVPAV